MAQRELNILVTASLKAEPSLKKMQNQIKEMQKALGSLNIDVKIDNKIVETIKNLSNILDKAIIANKEMNRVMMEEINIMHSLDGVMTKHIKQYLEDGTVIDRVIKSKREGNKVTEEEVSANKKLSESLDNLKRKREMLDANGKTTGYRETYGGEDDYETKTYNLDKDRKIKNSSIDDNNAKRVADNEKYLDSVDRVKKGIISLRHEGIIAEQSINDLNTSLNLADDLKQIDKVVNALKELEREENRIKRLGELQGAKGAVPKESFKDSDSMKEYLSKQYNTESKNVNVTKSGDGFKFVVKDIKDGEKTYREVKGTVDQATESVFKFNQETRNLATRDFSGLALFKQAMSSIPVWFSAMTIFVQGMNAVKSIISTMVDVDTQVTDMKRVMDSQTDFGAVLENNARMAKELGQSLTDVNNASIQFAQQGFNQSQTADLTKTAIIASNVSDLTVDQSASDITAAMTAFNIEASKSITIVDKLNAVDNDYAVTTKDLAEGIHKAGATASAYGVTLDELAGQIAAISTTTRESGNIIGNSLKTIYSRITAPDSLKELKKIDINPFNVDGTTKTATTVLTDLHNKWDSLTNAQRQNLGVVLAGREQLSRFLALMQNYDIAVNATNTAMNSQGSAMEENQKYQESMQAQINKLKASWQEFAVVFSQKSVLGDAFMLAIEAATKFLNVITEASKETNGWNIRLAELALAAGILPIIAAGFTSIKTAIMTTTLATEGLTLAVKGLGIATGVGIVLALASTAFTMFSGSTESVQKNTDAMRENAQQTEGQATKLESLIALHDKLAKTADFSTKSQNELQAVLKEIQKINPSLTESTDKYGQTLKLNSDRAKEYLETLKLMSKEQLQQTRDKDKNMLDDSTKSLEEQNKKIKELDATKENSRKQQQAYYNDFHDANGNSAKTDDEAKKNYDALMVELTNKKNNALSVGDVSGVNQYSQSIDKLRNEYIAYFAFIAQNKKILDDFNAAVTGRNNEQQNNNTLKTNVTNEDKLLSGTKDLTKAKQDNLVVLNQQTGAYEINEAAVAGSVEANQNLFDTYDQVKKQVEPLNSLLQDMAQGKKISADRAMELVMADKDLVGAITVENGVVKLNQKAIEDVRDAHNKTFTDKANGMATDLENQKKHLAATLQNFGIEIKGLQDVAAARNALIQKEQDLAQNKLVYQQNMNKFSQQVADGQTPTIPVFNIEQTKLGIQAQEYAVNNIKPNLDQMESVLNDIDKLKNMSNLADAGLKTIGQSPDKKEKEAKNPVDQYQVKAYENAIAALDSQMKDSEYQMGTMNKTSAEYRVELEKQIKLLQQKQVLTHTEADRLRGVDAGLRSQIASLGSYNSLSDKQKESWNNLSKDLDENEKQIQSLSQNWLDWEQNIDTKRFDEVNSKLDEMNNLMGDINDSLEISKNVQNQYKEGSAEYRTELEKQVALLRQKQEAAHQEADYIRQQLADGKLTIEQQQQLSEKLKQLGKDWWSYASEIKTTNDSIHTLNEKLADDVIQSMKDMYGKQKDILTKAIDEQEKALEDSHKTRMDALDAEMKKYEDATQAKLKYLDKEKDDRKYAEDIKGKTDERAKLQTQYDALSLNDSTAAKAKKKDLAEKLAKIDQEIGDLNYDRQNDLIKKQLQDDLDAKKDKTDTAKKADDTQLKNEKDALDKQKKATEIMYDNLINDEKTFTKIKEDILTGHFENVKKILNDTVTSYSKTIDDEFARTKQMINEQQNLLNNAKDLSGNIGKQSNRQDALNNYVDNKIQANMQHDQTGTWNQDLATQNEQYRKDFGFVDYDVNQMKDESFKKYIANKLQAQKIFDETGKWDEKLASENSYLRQQYGFPDYSTDDIIKLKLYHNGGSVGVDNPSGATGMINRLFNVQPNEQVIKALHGELMIPEGNITKNFIPNMKNFIGNIMNGKGQSSGDKNIVLNINIDKVTGDQNGGKTVVSEIVKGVQKLGKRI